MKFCLRLLLLLTTSLAFASTPLTASLKEMASSADHIIIGSVVGVDMIDENGRQITDPEAMTGPGLKNLIRLKIKVQKILVSNIKEVPNTLYIPLDPFMHYSLGDVREGESSNKSSFLLFLKGKEFSPIKAGVFARPLTDKKEAIRIFKATHK